MTNHLNLFATVARITLPTFSVGPIKHAHKARRTDHSRLPAVGDLLSIINGGIVYRPSSVATCATPSPRRKHRITLRCWRVDRAPIGPGHKTRLRSIRLQIGPALDLRRDL
jgi:hypothetical protein